MANNPKSANSDDFLFWEEKYGRKLSEVERLEIKKNLLSLLDIVE